MAKKYRVKCPKCGEMLNLPESGACKKCGTLIDVHQQGTVALYRMGNFVGGANAFSIYINEVPYGFIGNRECLQFPLPFGEYKLHIACGMNRRCNDPVVRLSAEEPLVCFKVHMKMGFVQNSFILERVDPSEMPE